MTTGLPFLMSGPAFVGLPQARMIRAAADAKIAKEVLFIMDPCNSQGTLQQAGERFCLCIDQLMVAGRAVTRPATPAFVPPSERPQAGIDFPTASLLRYLVFKVHPGVGELADSDELTLEIVTNPGFTSLPLLNHLYTLYHSVNNFLYGVTYQFQIFFDGIALDRFPAIPCYNLCSYTFIDRNNHEAQ